MDQLNENLAFGSKRESKISNVKSDPVHVTPSRLPFAVHLDLKSLV